MHTSPKEIKEKLSVLLFFKIFIYNCSYRFNHGESLKRSFYRLLFCLYDNHSIEQNLQESCFSLSGCHSKFTQRPNPILWKKKKKKATIRSSPFVRNFKKAQVGTSATVWIIDHLTNQSVRLKACLSEWVVSSTGAPQGTLLLPLLFHLRFMVKLSFLSAELVQGSEILVIIGVVAAKKRLTSMLARRVKIL